MAYRTRRRRSPRMRRRFAPPNPKSQFEYATDVATPSAVGTTNTVAISATDGSHKAIRNLHGLWTFTGSSDTDYAVGLIGLLKLNETENDVYTSSEVAAILTDPTESSRLFCVHPFAVHGKNMVAIPVSCRSVSLEAGSSLRWLTRVNAISGTLNTSLSVAYRQKVRDI